MFTTRPELRGTLGMVASTHWLASAAGMAMLERGGNAFDAAAAAGFTLQVVEPHLNGPGGEVPIVLHDSTAQLTRVVCGQGVAPAAATIPRFRELGLDLVPGSGLLAAVVPGAFDAWLVMLRDHGSMTLAEVLEPAIGYAQRGFPLVPRATETIAQAAGLFRDAWPTSAEVYLKRGDPPPAGSLFANPVLAETYMRILGEAAQAGADRIAQIEAARRIWYSGFVAEAIDRFCATEEVLDSSGRRHRGLLNGDDLVGWEATYERPVSYDYHGYLVFKTGPWGQGPVMLQQLALLKDIDIGAMDPVGADFVHTVTEAAKLAYADREAFYGDPIYTDVPLNTLLSDAYNDHRRLLIGDEASAELRPGHPGSTIPVLPPVVSEDGPEPAAGVGEPTLGRLGEARGDTCHIDVVDNRGNMVSATPSGGWLQSSPIIPDLGFALTTRAQMFWLTEGLPSSLAPGRRPRTTLTPTVVLRDGTGCLALGTPGGDMQDQWSLTLLLRLVHHRLNLQQAIDAPMFHTEHMPSSFWPRRARPGHLALEGRFDAATVEALARRGHSIDRVGDWDLGRLSAVGREGTPEGTILKAAANPRHMQGYAVGR